MSSIYRKGRDGYYYYQTYIYNPKSKKKDKRIFYALGTKDLLEAKKKQYEFDLQHENQNHTKKKSLLSSYNLHPKQATAIVAGIIAILIFFVDFFMPNKVPHPPIDIILTEKDMSANERIDTSSNTIDSVKSIISNKAENISEIIEPNLGPKTVETKVTLPKYYVERVETLSGVFEQGKLYVTINDNSNNESQRFLCKELRKRYDEFANIVICLYANDRAGKDLAKGNDETVSVEEQKNSWLAMYSYNAVEGEYFDDNPSGYLGIY